MLPIESLWVEVRAAVRRSGPPKLVPLSEVGKYTGFRSVFAYPKEVAEKILEQGGSYGLRGVPVFADTLFMDFDNYDPAEFVAWLREQGYAFDLYDSGNRSVHIHIPITPLFGSWVPAALKAWTEEHAPRADTSFLHPAGQYRLSGTFHSKNPGRCKTLLESVQGRVLEIAQPEAEDAEPQEFAPEESPTQFYASLLQSAPEGRRRPRAFSLAVAGLKSGHDSDEVLTLLQWWNSRYCNPPHHAQAIEDQVAGAVSYVSRQT